MEEKMQAFKQMLEMYLQEIVGPFEKGQDFYRIPYESTAIILIPLEWGPRILLRVAAVILKEITGDPELDKTLSELNREYLFGKFNYYPDSNVIFIEHYLLGDYLDKEELAVTLRALALTADEVDDQLKEKFGGKRFIDE